VYNDPELIITDQSINEPYTVPIKSIKANFIHGYCRTCHSYQGSTIDDDIIIFDWQHYCVDKKWLYTAVTRATDLKRVKFFSGKSKEFNNELLQTYAKNKIKNYMDQDKKAKREINEEKYMKPKQFISWIRSCCKSCGDPFQFEISRSGTITCNLTANRIDNDDAHHRDNIEPMCITCNCSLSNR
jgi:hypothetical protein